MTNKRNYPIAGILGIDAAFDGTITVNPVKPALSDKMCIKGLKLRGKNIDVSVDGNMFYVSVDGNKYFYNIGKPVRIDI